MNSIRRKCHQKRKLKTVAQIPNNLVKYSKLGISYKVKSPLGETTPLWPKAKNSLTRWFKRIEHSRSRDHVQETIDRNSSYKDNAGCAIEFFYSLCSLLRTGGSWRLLTSIARCSKVANMVMFIRFLLLIIGLDGSNRAKFRIGQLDLY